MEIFIGREQELEAIRQLLKKDKGVLLFTGESGMGKTTLLRKAMEEWQGQPGTIVASHECYHSDTGPSPFVALLAHLLQRLGPERLRSPVGHLKAFVKGLVGRTDEAAKGFLGWFAGQVGADQVVRIVFEEAGKQALLPGVQNAAEILAKYPMVFVKEYLDCLTAFTQDFPDSRFLLVLDQMERPDIPALNILKDLADKLPPRTFLLIGFMLEADIGEEKTRLKFATISARMGIIAEVRELPGLPEAEIRDWIKQATGQDLLGPQLRAIKQASGGLPQLLGPWIEEWQQQGGGPDMQRLRQRDALDRYFQARLDSLSTEAQEFAYRLSILLDPLGDFPLYCQLVELTQGKATPAQCQGWMRELEAKLVFGDRWWFRHEKVQAYIERQLHPHLRKQYHRAAATLFEGKLPKPKEGEKPEIPFYVGRSLSLHYHGAEEWHKSLAVNTSLAEFAFGTGSLDVAEECYLRAEAAAGKMGEEGAARAARGNLGRVYQLWGRVEDALQIQQDMLKFSKEEGDKKGQATALHNLGIIEQHQGNLEKAEGLYRKELQVAREVEDKGGIAKVVFQLANVEYLRGNLIEGEKLYQKSLGAFREIGDKAAIAVTLHQLASIEKDRGNLDKAEALYRESLGLKGETGDKAGIAHSLHQLGMVEQDRGNPEEAEKLYQNSLQLKREVGDKAGIANSLAMLGIIEQHRGNLDKAENIYRESLQLDREIGNKAGIAMCLHQFGNIHYLRGNLDQAQGLYGESLKLFQEVGDKGGIASSLGQSGLVYEERKDYEEALRHFVAAYTLFHEMGMPEEKIALAGMARIKDRLGERKFKEIMEAQGKG